MSGAATVAGETNVALQPPGGWLRLTRSERFLESAYSADGTTWKTLGWVGASLPEKLLVGMVVASGTSDGKAWASFANYGSTKPVIISSPQPRTAAPGENVNLEVTVRGTAPISYQWMKNIVAIPGATSRSLLLTAVTINAVGDYTVRVSNQFGTVTSPIANLNVGGTSPGGLKGDVYPAPYGDSAVTLADWVRVGKFVAGIEGWSTDEFFRADTAPKNDGGDGFLTIADWVQTGKYAAGLDLPTASRVGLLAAGILSPPIPRHLRLESIRAGDAGPLEIPVTLRTFGGDNAIAFSVEFDPRMIRYRSARLAGQTSGAMLLENAMRAAEGGIGILIGLPTQELFPAGEIRICWLRFELLSRTGMAELAFSDVPVRRELVDLQVNSLPVIYENGVVTVNRGANLALGWIEGGQLEILFSAEAGATYLMEISDDLVTWRKGAEITARAVVERISVLASEARRQFYRVRPVN
ncbi:MAG: immunoglobulin domain-containing protein [Verrucomicrobiales bacterium]|nr:immunoglobulin domain-containing protein [Verrucomicrobiales bacterium]